MSTSGHYCRCIVPKCKNTSISAPGKQFISVPRNPLIRKKWCRSIKRCEKNAPLAPNSKAFCCEDHFDLPNDMENFMIHKVMSLGYWQLKAKKGVLPHIFECQQPSRWPKRKTGERRRRLEIIKDLVEPNLQPSTSRGGETITEVTAAKETVTEEIFAANLPEENAGSSVNYYVEKSTQVTLKCKYRSIGLSTQLIKSKNIALSPIKCNLHNMSTSPMKGGQYIYDPESNSSNDTSADYVPSDIAYVKEPEVEIKEYQKLMLQGTLISIEREPRLFLGIPPISYYVVKLLEEEVRAPLRNILLTLRKIRLNESYAMLALCFGMSESNVGNIFTSTLILVATALQELIFWPEADKIKEKLPITFRARYSKVQSIIDCLEIQIEKPSDPVHQAASWSAYKNCNTAKYLISCTPDGLVNYVSEGYGGRVTDTALINDCGYYKCLKPGMHIMADRGFKNIGGILQQLGCVLVRPPSVVGDSKFTKQEVKEGKRIAALRIHVERVIGRLREFKMLEPHATTDNHHVQLLDYIIVCASGIINVQEKLIKF